jgi:hypothetical protein
MIKADARKLPFKTGVFQMISLLSVLEHIPEKWSGPDTDS